MGGVQRLYSERERLACKLATDAGVKRRPAGAKQRAKTRSSEKIAAEGLPRQGHRGIFPKSYAKDLRRAQRLTIRVTVVG